MGRDTFILEESLNRSDIILDFQVGTDAIALPINITVADLTLSLVGNNNIQTLQEYLLIDAERMNVECFCPNDRGKWELTTYSAGEEIFLTSLNFHCPIELLYEEVRFSS